MGLKMLHSADWHLDSPFAGFTPSQREMLKAAQQTIPQQLADLCRRENCDLVLLSGDLFDGVYHAETVERVKQALKACGVPVFIAPGNHDFCAPGAPWLEETWPDNVHIFTGGLDSLAVKALDCRIYGAGYQSMDCPGLLEGFRAEGEERYHIAVLHGDPVQLGSPYCPITAAQVRDSALDYLALGHIHKAGSFRAGSTLCGWPGTPMGRGYDETGEKGLYLVEIGEQPHIQRIVLDMPQFQELTVNTEEQKLEDFLPAAGNAHFYRVTLTGSGEDIPGDIPLKFPNMEILDRREEPVDLWNSAEEDTLEGTYFRILREAMAEADSDSAAQIQLAAKLSRKILEGREVVL